MPSSSRKPATFSPPAQPAAYCPRAVVRSSRGGRQTLASTFCFSIRRLVGVERRRLLHRDQRHQLEEVVLDHVAGGADAVVVAGPAADADVLGHRDLHVVDVVGVPDRLEHGVREPHRQDVLDRLLAEVVVDPEDRARREDAVQDAVQRAGGLAGRARTASRRRPAARSPRVGCGQAVLLELPDHVAEERRRDREVERVVAVGAADLVELLDGAPQLSKATSSSKLPGTNRKPSASCRQTSSRNSVRAYALTESCTICAKSWLAQSRRAKPTRLKPGGSRPRLARS